MTNNPGVYLDLHQMADLFFSFGLLFFLRLSSSYFFVEFRFSPISCPISPFFRVSQLSFLFSTPFLFCVDFRSIFFFPFFFDFVY